MESKGNRKIRDMKKLIFILAAVLTLLPPFFAPASAKSKTDALTPVMKAAGKVKGAEYVTIGKFLLKLAAVGAEDEEKEVLKCIDSMAMLSMEKASEQERADFSQRIAGVLADELNGFVFAEEEKDEESGNIMKLYLKCNEKDQIEDFVMFEEKTCTVMHIQGKFDREQLAKLKEISEEEDDK